MRQSKYFLKTSKTVSEEDISTNALLLEQGGFISKTMAGVYSLLPLGVAVLFKIEAIVREEMQAIGASEVLLPSLHPKSNWEQTGRWSTLDVLFKVESQYGFDYALGPTHEEIVTPLALNVLGSYRDLPKSIFQIQTKFRDEARAKSGLMRGREFRMKDLYSFHATEEDLELYYKVVADSYHRIFSQIGLDAIYTEASGGTFSKFSHEFQIEVGAGEDTIYICEKCNIAKNKEVFDEIVTCTICGERNFREAKASEVGNIFRLKSKFSEPFNLNFTTEKGDKLPVLMGCYGIGTSRLMGVLVEKYHDEKGIVWPESVAPFQVHLISLPGRDGTEVVSACDKLYEELKRAGIEIFYDDRQEVSAGEKFADSDLIGIPIRLVVSTKTLTENSVEYKKRSEIDAKLIKLDQIREML